MSDIDHKIQEINTSANKIDAKLQELEILIESIKLKKEDKQIYESLIKCLLNLQQQRIEQLKLKSLFIDLEKQVDDCTDEESLQAALYAKIINCADAIQSLCEKGQKIIGCPNK